MVQLILLVLQSHRAFVVTVQAALLTSVLLAAPAHAAPPVGEAAPDFALRALSGENQRLSEHSGEVVLINFWATWSGPSRQEIPALEDLHAKYQRAGLVLLGINLDDDVDRAREMVQTLRVSYPVLTDERKDVARSYQVSAMPLTVLIDREGVVRFVSESYKPGDEARYAQELRKLLNE
ncbi:MAG: TlpA disulfide reductase family protein [Steroidobacteraceae bacterium]